jgi:hypothetical protein
MLENIDGPTPQVGVNDAGEVQAQNYVTALNAANDGDGIQPHAVMGSATSGKLAGYVDGFLVRTSSICNDIGDDDSPQYVYDLYVSWAMADGIVAIKPFKSLACFNPNKEEVPIPVGEYTWKGYRVPLDDFAQQLRQQNNGMAIKWGGGPIVTPASVPGGGGGGGGGGQEPVQQPVNTPPPNSVPPATTPPSGPDGDPHMATFDGLAYDLMSIGEFQLVKSDSLGLNSSASCLVCAWTAASSKVSS